MTNLLQIVVYIGIELLECIKLRYSVKYFLIFLDLKVYLGCSYLFSFCESLNKRKFGLFSV